MNINDVVNDSVKMMEKVEMETNKMKDELDETLTLIIKYRKYIETFHPEVHNAAVEYINGSN